jgi:hypothetical protein
MIGWRRNRVVASTTATVLLRSRIPHLRLWTSARITIHSSGSLAIKPTLLGQLVIPKRVMLPEDITWSLRFLGFFVITVQHEELKRDRMLIRPREREVLQQWLLTSASPGALDGSTAARRGLGR